MGGSMQQIEWLRSHGILTCEAVTALCELIDELLKDIQHLGPEVISARKANVYAGTNISLKRRPFWGVLKSFSRRHSHRCYNETL